MDTLSPLRINALGVFGIFIGTMNICLNLLVNTISTSILTTLVLLSYLSSTSYFYNQYATATSAHSSLVLQKTPGIQICCSWGKEIDDGILTYRISDGDNSQVVKIVRQAIDEWNSKLPNIQLQEVTDSDADIDTKTSSKSSKVSHTFSTVIDGPKISAGKNIKLVAPGEAQISFERRGFITHVAITISTKALGNSISSSQLEAIAKHEIGHSYGIGHTNFIGDLMSPVLTPSTNTNISQCDINAIEAANGSPHSATPQLLRC
jgi:Matrixin